MVRPTLAARDRAIEPCAKCGHSRFQHGRMENLVRGVFNDRRMLCMDCPGYVVEVAGVDEDGYYHGGTAWHRFVAKDGEV